MNKKGMLIAGLAVLVIGLNLVAWITYQRRYDRTLQELQTLQATASPQTAGAAAGIPDTGYSDKDPFTIAFISDTETLSRWDDLLRFIAAEGADLVVHQGDYIDGMNPVSMEPPTWDDLLSAQAVDTNGTPTGELDCERGIQGLGCILGKEFPILGSAVGKNLPERLEDTYLHFLNRIESMGGEWGGCVKDGLKGDPGVRMDGCGLDDNLANSRAADYWVRMNGVTLLFQNVMPDTNWAGEALAGDDNIWKLCMWHGNHFDFQTGDKGAGYDGEDHSLPYEMYSRCAEQGALIINGNEHAYSRTCVLTDIGNLKEDGPGAPNRVNREPGTELENHGAECLHAGATNQEAANAVEELEVGPGRSLVLISAIAGYAWRDYHPEVESLIPQDTYRHDNDGWWATIFTTNRYCRNNCTLADLSGQNPDAYVPGMDPPVKEEEPADTPWDPYSDGHGVLFITFNYENDPYQAHGYFKKMKPDPDTGEQIVDEFILTYVP